MQKLLHSILSTVDTNQWQPAWLSGHVKTLMVTVVLGWSVCVMQKSVVSALILYIYIILLLFILCYEENLEWFANSD